MLIKNTRDYLQQVYKEGFALPAFNVCNLEMARAVIEAAVEERAPVIVQTYVGDVEHAGLEYISHIVKMLAAEADVPVVLHHDHASDYSYIMQVLKAGYGSCMVDTHELNLEEAIAKTAEIAKVAHALKVAIEGELGSWDSPDDQTDPALVGRMIAEAEVDMLAVSVGSQHGQSSRLNLGLLEQIAAAAKTPLVLHGGTGIDDNDLKAAIKLGVVKVNIGAALSRAWVEGSAEAMQTADPKYLHYKMLAAAQDKMRQAARAKLRLMGASGRA